MCQKLGLNPYLYYIEKRLFFDVSLSLVSAMPFSIRLANQLENLSSICMREDRRAIYALLIVVYTSLVNIGCCCIATIITYFIFEFMVLVRQPRVLYICPGIYCTIEHILCIYDQSASSTLISRRSVETPGINHSDHRWLMLNCYNLPF